MPRVLSLRQVLLLPTLTTLGLGLLLLAHELNMPAIAAPLPRTQPTVNLPPPGATASATVSSPPLTNNPEFAGAAPLATEDHIRATTRDELVRLARENSGREDPFVALIMPDPGIVQPLIETPVSARPINRLIPVRPTVRIATRMSQPEIAIDPPERGDEPARGPMIVPRWSLTGVLNTGREQLALLEMDGMSREARLGEVLEDGARVVKIEGNRVVLMLNGRRFPKTIGSEVDP